MRNETIRTALQKFAASQQVGEEDSLHKRLIQALEMMGRVQMMKGEKGDVGLRGPAGYTPKKNVDYFDGRDGQDGVRGNFIFSGNEPQNPLPGDLWIQD